MYICIYSQVICESNRVSPSNLKIFLAFMWSLYLIAFYWSTLKVSWTYIHDLSTVLQSLLAPKVNIAHYRGYRIPTILSIFLWVATWLLLIWFHKLKIDPLLTRHLWTRLEERCSWIKANTHFKHFEQETRDPVKGKKEKKKIKKKKERR